VFARLICISVNMSSLVVAFGAWAFSSYEGWSYVDTGGSYVNQTPVLIRLLSDAVLLSRRLKLETKTEILSPRYGYRDLGRNTGKFFLSSGDFCIFEDERARRTGCVK